MPLRVIHAKPQSSQVRASRTQAVRVAGEYPSRDLSKNSSRPVGLPWSFSRIPTFGPGRGGQTLARATHASPSLRLPILPKLEIGSVDDPLEREADQVADRVMRMPDPGVSTTTGDGGTLRRKCSCG